MKKSKQITALTTELARPLVEAQGCTLWDVEYVREAGTWILRVLIDREPKQDPDGNPGAATGGVDILDCEAISRKLSDLLDEADPIADSYTLEVGSAGAERPLKRPSDFQKFLGSPVLLTLYRKLDGRKEIPGSLLAYDADSGSVTIQPEGDPEPRVFAKEDVALVRLRVDFSG